jgi:hypothetical protein
MLRIQFFVLSRSLFFPLAEVSMRVHMHLYLYVGCLDLHSVYVE